MPDLLRLVIAGSVDCGKSTTVGRLLFDSKQVFDDQLAQIERASIRRARGHLDLSLLTDGLRAEREQGITIDVAYRYFSTPRRTFVLADTPGHVQYTRNMVTGASTASLCVLVIGIDAGLAEQTRRHAAVASMLGVRSLIVAVNKMDLVEMAEEPFARLRAEFEAFLADLPFDDVRFIPISALNGDNIVRSSDHMPWYDGPPLLDLLETIPIPAEDRLDQLRLPVQLVIRSSAPGPETRSYPGRIASGRVRVGDDVVVLPSRLRTRVATITVGGTPTDEARYPQSVAVTLEDDVDVSRGHMIASPGAEPLTLSSFEASLCWMSEAPLRAGARYAVKHTTNWSRVRVDRVDHRLDLQHLRRREESASLELNDLGQVSLTAMAPLFGDPYERSRSTGSFVLVDEASDDTVAAGMILRPVPAG
ncbi:MAG TPA: GTP-binding protein [Candidatus Saccharimonadales bacterium]|nr:GTP-binding protein [Candidatus Saccharimonadales bacterium]